MTTAKIKALCYLIRLHQPIGLLLLLWPTYWALWVASKGHPSLVLFVVFTLGVFLMRSAGDVINDIFDRNFDPHVKRTKNRPLANGSLSVTEALLTFGFLLFLSALLLVFLNTKTKELAVIGVCLAIIYPLMKRYFNCPQMILGLAYSWGIPMAFMAENQSVPAIAWVLFLVNWLWVMIYDTQYALVDKADDLTIGIKSSAVFFGKNSRLIIGLFQIIALGLLLTLAFYLELNLFFYLALISASLLFIYQQYLIREEDPASCFKAFRNNHWFGFMIFLGFVLGFI